WSTILCVPLVRGDFERLPAAALQADLESLKSTLERLHPGLHRYTSVEELEATFRGARGEVEGGMTVPEFYRVVSEVIAAVRCGHTRARMPEGVRRTFFADHKVLPFTVRILQGKVFVIGALAQAQAQGLKPGSEIRAIDQQPIEGTVSRLLACLGGDGQIE